MITDSMPPVISNATYDELLIVKRLAQDVYLTRENFSELCKALDKLYIHFDKSNPFPKKR